MIRYKEIAFAAYPVTDIARARKFYEGVLGLKPSAPLKSETQQWIEYDIGPGTLGIGCSEQWKPSKDGPSIALEVEDFAGAVSKFARAQRPNRHRPDGLAVVRNGDSARSGRKQTDDPSAQEIFVTARTRRLNPVRSREPQGPGSLRPSFEKLFSSVNSSQVFLTCVSDGNPFRRLLGRSKKGLVAVCVDSWAYSLPG